ncbi:MAG: NAD-dependent DNA ligase LigA, partial [Bacilli bacterium]|nr:NAD-dependent DNA ligase LigA [Bacilli bacterium]
IDIIYTVGRTGKITPNALLEPVFVAGSTVKKATLHNYDFIKNLDIRLNDYVVIHKSGDIIPEVIEVVLDKRQPSAQSINMISNCPICQSKLQQIDDSVDYYCLNPDCDAKKIESIIHFSSRNALNIVGLGEKQIEFFYNEGYLKKISDIYDIVNYENDIINAKGFGKLSFENLISSINESKKASLDQVLFGLGIRHLGNKSAKVLCANFKSIDDLINATYDELLTIKEIGHKIAQSIIAYFSDEKNILLINKLKNNGLLMNNSLYQAIRAQDSYFSNKIIVLTGTLLEYSRDELKMILEKKNATITNSVSKKTDLIISGSKSGSKLDKGISLNIPIMNEEELLNILDEENTND